MMTKQVTFKVNHYKLYSFVIDLDTQKITDKESYNIKMLEIAFSEIHNLSYVSLEKFLQLRMQSKDPLEKLLAQIQQNGFFAAYQHNLRIDVQDVLYEQIDKSVISVTIPDGETCIAKSAFMDCKNLESVIIPDSVTEIGRTAFSGCGKLVSVTIPDGVTKIGNAAFMYCTSLANITIPDSVTNIEQLAFCGTAWYNNQSDGVVYAGKVAYEYKGEMPINASIVLRDGTIAISDEAFAHYDGYENLVSITIPDSVIYIGKRQFENCEEDFKGNITIRCRNNSYAHTYAIAENIKFEIIA